MIRVLGLDPGSRTTGWGVVERQGRRLVLVDQGTIKLGAGRPLAERLVRLSTAAEELVAATNPSAAVLETTFFGINPKSLIVLSQARGALVAAVARSGLPVHEHTPAEVKAAVTGYGRADKEQVAKMVRLVLGLGNRPLASDASDALAVAVCHLQRHGSGLLPTR